jgi:alpha-D-ribose 1-methylphosphonate 5-triphosphate synthase subunit PhnH
VPEGSTVLRLQGPGVPDVRWVAVTGLALGVVEAFTEANAAFPAGIDVWLADRTGRVLGLPRSCTVTVDHDPANQNPGNQDQTDQEDR